MIEPVEIEHVRDHRFVKRRASGCDLCGRRKDDVAHHGCAPTTRVLGSGANHFTYQRIKHIWQTRYTDLLIASGLPIGLDRVVVEGQMCFGDRTRRDQGNFRYLTEKALGDALKEGGWIEDDDWGRYEFGGLAYRYEKGRAWTRLMLFPTSSSHG